MMQRVPRREGVCVLGQCIGVVGLPTGYLKNDLVVLGPNELKKVLQIRLVGFSGIEFLRSHKYSSLRVKRVPDTSQCFQGGVDNLSGLKTLLDNLTRT